MRYLVLFTILLVKFVVESRLVELTPLKCSGRFCTSANQMVAASYLCRGKLEVLESGENGDQNRAILCDVIPIPLLDSRGESLVSQLQNNQQQSVQFGFDTNSVNGIFVNRDKGIYDNLPYCWRKDINAKLELFNLMQRSRGTSGPGSFLNVINDILDAKISSLIIEVRDEISSNKISIGAAVVFCRNSVADEWRVSSSDPGLPEVSNTDDLSLIQDATALIVECHLDELVALSLLSGLPILIPRSLFESLAIDAALTNDESDSTMSINGPIFRSAEKRKDWNDRSEASKDSDNIMEAPPAWEIFDPKRFLKMSPVEKRAVLRASGVTSLPRPRDGLDSLDRALLDQMDDAVRDEVLRLSSKGVVGPGPAMSSSRQIILQAIGNALESGDLKKATELREEFMISTARKADPTQADGSYDPYLDQDDWYMAARRKAMAPKK